MSSKPAGHLTPTQLILTALGAPSLRGGLDRTSILGLGNTIALLTYLALAPQGTATCDHLVYLLWGDRNVDRGRHPIQQTL